ncbi:MAG: hypothetical protein ABJA78_05695 [Ferruginibacter sp.]
MKKILPFLFVAGCLFSQAQIKVKVGDKFIYDVAVGADTYNFTVVVKSTSPGFEFAWQMTNENQSYGKLSISPAALASANKMYNYFSGGDVALKDMTSVLISRDAFKKISTRKTTVLSDGDKKYSFKNDGKDQFTYTRNGQSEQADGYYISDGNYIMTILNDPEFPLIVSMDLGFSIKLSEYIPAAKQQLNLADFIHNTMHGDACKPLWAKVNKTSAIYKEDGGSAKNPLTYLTYYDCAEGLKVETKNDTVTSIIYYPTEMYHSDKKYYGSNFIIPQVKNFSLARPLQKKAVGGKFIEAMQYDADSYSTDNGVRMEVYYHVPKKGVHGWEFNLSNSGQPANQKAAFVTFE